jgi:hypothetical protein
MLKLGLLLAGLSLARLATSDFVQAGSINSGFERGYPSGPMNQDDVNDWMRREAFFRKLRTEIWLRESPFTPDSMAEAQHDVDLGRRPIEVERKKRKKRRSRKPRKPSDWCGVCGKPDHPKCSECGLCVCGCAKIRDSLTASGQAEQIEVERKKRKKRRSQKPRKPSDWCGVCGKPDHPKCSECGLCVCGCAKIRDSLAASGQSEQESKSDVDAGSSSIVALLALGFILGYIFLMGALSN